MFFLLVYVSCISLGEPNLAIVQSEKIVPVQLNVILERVPSDEALLLDVESDVPSARNSSDYGISRVACLKDGRLLVESRRPSASNEFEVVKLTYQDGQPWSRGAVNRVFVSADSDWFAAVEEQGRLAIVRRSSGEFRAVSFWRPYLVSNEAAADFWNSFLFEGAIVSGLSIAGCEIVYEPNPKLLVLYADESVLEYDPVSFQCTRTLFRGTANWARRSFVSNPLGEYAEGTVGTIYPRETTHYDSVWVGKVESRPLVAHNLHPNAIWLSSRGETKLIDPGIDRTLASTAGYVTGGSPFAALIMRRSRKDVRLVQLSSSHANLIENSVSLAEQGPRIAVGPVCWLGDSSYKLLLYSKNWCSVGYVDFNAGSITITPLNRSDFPANFIGQTVTFSRDGNSLVVADFPKLRYIPLAKNRVIGAILQADWLTE